jgi:small conductance mechanosensitive channel
MLPAGFLLSTQTEEQSGWSKVWNWLVGTPLTIVLILVVAFVTRWFVNRAITRIVNRTAESSLHDRLAEQKSTRVLVAAGGPLLSERRKQRAATIGSVMRSVSSIIILGIAGFMVLGQLGIDLAPLIAGAGVAGVAIGFGAQSLVKDFLSGIFMMLEDQYGVGDVIDTGAATGTVEAVTLRITQLRDGNGVVWYVRNGEILRVGNKSQGWSMAIVDIPVAYTEDIPRVQELIRTVADELSADPGWDPKILETPDMAGVESMTGDAVTLRIIVKCAPNENFGVQRELRARVKDAFDREGIRVPAPLRPYGDPSAHTPTT